MSLRSTARHIVVSSLLAGALCSSASGDELYLRNGKCLDGRVSEDTDSVQVEVEYGSIKIPRRDVERISYDSPEKMVTLDTILEDIRTSTDPRLSDAARAHQWFLERMRCGDFSYVIQDVQRENPVALYQSWVESRKQRRILYVDCSEHSAFVATISAHSSKRPAYRLAVRVSENMCHAVSILQHDSDVLVFDINFAQPIPWKDWVASARQQADKRYFTLGWLERAVPRDGGIGMELIDGLQSSSVDGKKVVVVDSKGQERIYSLLENLIPTMRTDIPIVYSTSAWLPSRESIK